MSGTEDIMDIDWVGFLNANAGPDGWEDADGPDSGVGESYWFAAGDGTFARLSVDQGHAELAIVPQDEDEDDESRTLWSGDLEDASDDPELAPFVRSGSPTP